jgi:16S rRNA (cytosine967-C5)-methyltransferase
MTEPGNTPTGAKTPRGGKSGAKKPGSGRPKSNERKSNTRQKRKSKGGGGSGGAPAARHDDPGVEVRRVALQALERIDDGAYANLALSGLLDRSTLDTRDRALVAELVYGTTRMARACDHLVDRFTLDSPDAGGRRALRLGAYQLRFTRIPNHAAVDATVSASPKRLRGFVNAVLRKLSAETEPAPWPDLATELSYPTWMLTRLEHDLNELLGAPQGATAAVETLRKMNEAASVDTRADGAIQNRASQWVAELVQAEPGHRVLDLCAAPGGKAGAMAAGGALVTAVDVRPARTRHMERNLARLGHPIAGVVVGDGLHIPFAPGVFDRVLVDAPCSGLGVLRRRPDARWRVKPADIDELAALQLRLLESALPTVAPGGMLVYSVCTLTLAETVRVASAFSSAHPELSVVEAPGEPWRPVDGGAMLLPHDADTDGMAVFGWRRRA